MTRIKIATGPVHKVPADFREAPASDSTARAMVNGITQPPRNQWICWVISGKKPETRAEHISRACSQLKDGKRRPCCWPGCPHRNHGRQEASR